MAHLQLALERGDVALLHRELSGSGAFQLKTADMGNGNTALHTAARLGAAEIVEQLLFFGTPLALNQTRESPLMLAMSSSDCRRRRTWIRMLYLLRNNLTERQRSTDDTPLLYGLRLLTRAPEQRSDTEFYLLVMLVEHVHARLDVGVTDADDAGDTPLHLAVRNNAIKVVRLLLQCGARPRQVNKAGVSPYDEANGEIRRVLRDAVADSISEKAERAERGGLESPQAKRTRTASLSAPLSSLGSPLSRTPSLLDEPRGPPPSHANIPDAVQHFEQQVREAADAVARDALARFQSSIAGSVGALADALAALPRATPESTPNTRAAAAPLEQGGRVAQLEDELEVMSQRWEVCRDFFALAAGVDRDKITTEAITSMTATLGSLSGAMSKSQDSVHSLAVWTLTHLVHSTQQQSL